MPVGGVHSVGFLLMSFQLVDSTVPLDSCTRPLPQHIMLQSLVARILHHLLPRVSHKLQSTLHVEFAETTIFNLLIQQCS